MSRGAASGSSLLDRALERIRPGPRQKDATEATVRRLAGLSSALSREIWVWDDSTIGGNKTRKLEWLLPATFARRARGVVVYGPTGSNWVRKAVEAAKSKGLAARAILFEKPMPPYALANLEVTDRLADQVVRVKSVASLVPAGIRMLAAHSDHELYPPGGTSVRGSLGYVGAARLLESAVLAGALPEPEWIFVAAGTGGTAAGLAVGLELTALATRVVAVRVTEKALMNRLYLETLTRRILARLGRAARSRGIPRRLGSGRLVLVDGWYGEGYAVATPAASAAVMAAEVEGLELETTYTGKALAALLELSDRLAGPFVFWNTFAGVARS